MEPTNKWISMRDAAAALECSRQKLHRMRERGEVKCREVDDCGFEYLLESLPGRAQEKYWSIYSPGKTICTDDAELYSSAPEYARRKADRYLQIIAAAGDATGAELHRFIGRWNHDHPDNGTSYSRLVTERSNYRKHGITALLGKWGKRSSQSSVPDDLFSFFKSLYLSDGRPSVISCWKITLGYAVKKGIPSEAVPSHAAFNRRLKKEIPEQAVYTAREGQSAANRKYAFYIKRKYDEVLSGECLISDHAQIDIACTYNDHGRTRVGYPWITAWRDFKSGFWTGWDFHMESPNSDHIFTSFYRSSVEHGVSSFLYLDNGKDFRVRDFAGGRKHHRLDIDEGKMTSLTAALGITTIFAWPYNAQSKAIERDFNRLKEWLSKHSPGYRGGNVVERPENHNATIAAGKILSFEDLGTLMDVFIRDVLMLSEVSSGYRAGRCPRQIWEEEYPVAVERQKVRRISKKALMLFCTRVSGVLTIGRRGIRDSQFGVEYYAAWMEGQKGRKVYIRRDPKAMQEAWVFDAATDQYLDNATILSQVDALALTDVSRDELKENISIKRNARRLIAELAKPDFEVPLSEKISALATATRVINDLKYYKPQDIPQDNTPILLTGMDKIFAEREEHKKSGKIDLSFFNEQIETEVDKRHKKIKLFADDTDAESATM